MELQCRVQSLGFPPVQPFPLRGDRLRQPDQVVPDLLPELLVHRLPVGAGCPVTGGDHPQRLLVDLDQPPAGTAITVEEPVFPRSLPIPGTFHPDRHSGENCFQHHAVVPPRMRSHPIRAQTLLQLRCGFRGHQGADLVPYLRAVQHCPQCFRGGSVLGGVPAPVPVLPQQGDRRFRGSHVNGGLPARPEPRLLGPGLTGDIAGAVQFGEGSDRPTQIGRVVDRRVRLPGWSMLLGDEVLQDAPRGFQVPVGVQHCSGVAFADVPVGFGGCDGFFHPGDASQLLIDGDHPRVGHSHPQRGGHESGCLQVRLIRELRQWRGPGIEEIGDRLVRLRRRQQVLVLQPPGQVTPARRRPRSRHRRGREHLPRCPGPSPSLGSVTATDPTAGATRSRSRTAPHRRSPSPHSPLLEWAWGRW